MNKLLRHFATGLILGLLILPPQPAQAQWTVFDPTQYALQVKKRIDELNRWLDTVKHYQEMYTKTVEQLTTLRGVLQTVDKQLFKNQQMALLANDIGKIINDSQKLRRRVESMVRYQIRALNSIDDRLSQGIFDPDADMRDLQDYLLYTMGRDARQTVDQMMRVASADAELSTWITDQEKLRNALKEVSARQDRNRAYLEFAEAVHDPANIQHLNDVILKTDVEIADLIKQIKELDQKITMRGMQYGLRLQDMENFGYEVQASNEMWKELQKTKLDLQSTMDSLILGTAPPVTE